MKRPKKRVMRRKRGHKAPKKNSATQTGARKYGFNTPLDSQKYYYLHNQGADQRRVFSSKEDFDRFEAYLYLLNAIESQRAANFFVGGRESEIFTGARGENLVAIGAYALLPHGFSILATPLVEGGIGKFMQKLQTAYTMFFNAKYGHTGRLFHSAYRSEELATEEMLKRTFARIHLSPAKLFDDAWEDSRGEELARLVMRAMEYRYSSANEYRTKNFVITSPTMFPLYLKRARDPRTYFALWMKYKDEIGTRHSKNKR